MSLFIHVGLTALYAVAFLWIIRKCAFFRIAGVSSRTLQILFAIKLLAGFGLWAIYTWYYPYRNTSDAFKYFDDAMIIVDMLRSEPQHFFQFLFGVNMDAPEITAYFDEMHCWTSSYSYGIAHDNPTIIRLNVLVGLISFGMYHVHTVFFSFMSFIGLVALFKSISHAIPQSFRTFALSLFICFPSVLLWSSGVLKEGPLILGFGLMVYCLFQLGNSRKSAPYFVGFLVSFIFLFTIKGYVIISALPAIISYVIFIFWSGAARKWLFPAVHILLFLVALNAHHFFIGGDLIYVLGMKQTDFYNVARMTNAGSAIEIPKIESVFQFIINAPGALYRTFFRPDIRDLKGIFQFVGLLESLLTLAIISIAVVFRKKAAEIRKGESLFLLSVVLSIGVLIGSVVPVVGALIRYKVPALIALLVLLFLIVDWTRLPFVSRETESVPQK
jgi:hypothetical protein